MAKKQVEAPAPPTSNNDAHGKTLRAPAEVLYAEELAALVRDLPPENAPAPSASSEIEPRFLLLFGIAIAMLALLAILLALR